MAARSASSAASPVAPTRPRVGLLYTHASPLSREGEYLAKYIGLALASTGATSKVAVVGVDVDASKASPRATDQHSNTNTTNSNDDVLAETSIIRADGIVFKKSNITTLGAYDETCDVRTLRDCHVWVLCLDAAATTNALQYVQKRVASSSGSDKTSSSDKPTPTRRVIISLQPAMRQLRDLDTTFPKDTVLHGGACFHLTKNKNGVLYPLSHGCYFIERLTSDKSHAVFALDLLEATGFQLLSRKNIQALKWGHTMLRLFYYLNALTGESVAASLRDRAMRLVYLEMLYEIDTLFTAVAASFDDGSSSSSNREATARRSWAPDASGSTYLSIHALMVVLPLPNWLFNNVVSKLVDVGLSASRSGFSTIARDVDAIRETEFWAEFKDVFELAKRRNMALPALATLQTTLTLLTQQHATLPDGLQPKLSGRGLLSQIPSTPASRAVSRTFFLKVIITVVATLLLGLYLMW